MAKKQPTTIRRRAQVHDLVQLEDKVDGIAETLNTTLEEVREVKVRLAHLPTKDDLTQLLSPLVQDTIRIKTVLREELNVEL